MSPSTPTLVFVPGSWHKPTCYDKIIKILREQHGLKCVAVTLPSTTGDPAATFKDDLDAARGHHRRALGLASRIGHAAAMCEAVEDLARDEVADRPEVAATLLRAARAERDRRGLPLRQRDARELADLERTLAAAGSQLTLRDRPFNDLVAELAE